MSSTLKCLYCGDSDDAGKGRVLICPSGNFHNECRPSKRVDRVDLVSGKTAAAQIASMFNALGIK